jgi:PKD repeat protein
MACSYIWWRRFLPVILYIVMILSGCKPLAVITVDRETGYSPLPLNFDASKSMDKGRDIRGYSWDFDNDGKFDALGIKVSHTFNNPGQYSVKLKVTDSKDNTSEAAKTIKVDKV